MSTFFATTKNLRGDIFKKRLELRSELVKQNPDVQKAEKLRREISDLESRFDQKRIDHIVNMRKINPNAGRGLGGRGRACEGPCWR